MNPIFVPGSIFAIRYWTKQLGHTPYDHCLPNHLKTYTNNLVQLRAILIDLLYENAMTM